MTSYEKKSTITPLWIVAAFVTFTEVVLGYALIQTTGGIQVALTIFVISYAVLVAAAFFLILWHRPYVFYPPSEYGDSDPHQYIGALQGASGRKIIEARGAETTDDTPLLISHDGSVDPVVRLPKYGFVLTPLDGDFRGGEPGVSIFTFLPSEDGFAPNVHVRIQAYKGTLKDYIEISLKEFNDAALKVVGSQEMRDEWLVEYTGFYGGEELMHWRARAVLAENKVYLITATSRESQWPKVSAELINCVSSFSLTRRET